MVIFSFKENGNGNGIIQTVFFYDNLNVFVLSFSIFL